MSDREELLKMVQTYSFAAYEWTLYLDTHPHDKEAISMHHKMSKLAKEYQMEFETKYGPLVAMDSTNTEIWDWIDKPWPWER